MSVLACMALAASVTGVHVVLPGPGTRRGIRALKRTATRRFYSAVEYLLAGRVEYTHPLVIGSCSSNCLPHRFLTPTQSDPID
ncbi:hypothetical protein J3F84DRAFT_354753 [Trichoderma pleuroticola]